MASRVKQQYAETKELENGGVTRVEIHILDEEDLAERLPKAEVAEEVEA